MEVILSLQQIEKSYGCSKKQMILDGINFEILSGEKVALLGETGCGKTTMAKIIMGLEEPDKGKVVYRKETLNALKKRSARQCEKMQYIFQDPYAALEGSYSIEETLLEPFKICQKNKGSKPMDPKEAFTIVGFDSWDRWKHKRTGELSGGQRQRLAIARALITRPEIIIADESTSMLDEKSSEDIIEVLKEIQQKEGITLICITHQLKVVKKLCDRVVILHRGKIVEDQESKRILVIQKSAYGKALIEAMKFFDMEDECYG